MSQIPKAYTQVFFCNEIEPSKREKAYQAEAKRNLTHIITVYKQKIFATHGQLAAAMLDELRKEDVNAVELLYGLYFYLSMFTQSKQLLGDVTVAIRNIFDYDKDKAITTKSAVKRLSANNAYSDGAQLQTSCNLATWIRWCAEQEQQRLIPKPASRLSANRNILFNGPAKDKQRLQAIAQSYLYKSSKNSGVACIFDFFATLFRKHKQLARALAEISENPIQNEIKPELLLLALPLYLKNYTQSTTLLRAVEDILAAKYGGMDKVPKNIDDMQKMFAYNDQEVLQADLVKHLQWCAKQDGRQLSVANPKPSDNRTPESLPSIYSARLR